MFGLSFFIFLGARCFNDNESDVGQKNTRAAKEWANAFQFDTKIGSQDLEAFTLSPHPFGSRRQNELSAYLMARLKDMGAKASVQEFTSLVPNRDYTPGSMRPITLNKNGANILGYIESSPQAQCLVIFASHYDSKELPGQRYVGANDSASSSILLLQMVSFLVKNKNNLAGKLPCNIGFVWFDGEEAVLSNWDDGIKSHPSKLRDNTYGSRFLAGKLGPCQKNFERQGPQTCFDVPIWKDAGPLKALILLDMIGSPDVSLTRDRNSSPELMKLVEKGLKEFGNFIPLSQREQNIEDDHIAFCQKGILCLDLIDFNHLDHWHQPSDTAETLSFESIEKIGKIALFLALSQ